MSQKRSPQNGPPWCYDLCRACGSAQCSGWRGGNGTSLLPNRQQKSGPGRNRIYSYLILDDKMVDLCRSIFWCPIITRMFESYCWWFRNPAITSWYGVHWFISHYLRRVLAPSKLWLALGFLNHQQYSAIWIHGAPLWEWSAHQLPPLRADW